MNFTSSLVSEKPYEVIGTELSGSTTGILSRLATKNFLMESHAISTDTALGNYGLIMHSVLISTFMKHKPKTHNYFCSANSVLVLPSAPLIHQWVVNFSGFSRRGGHIFKFLLTISLGLPITTVLQKSVVATMLWSHNTHTHTHTHKDSNMYLHTLMH